MATAHLAQQYHSPVVDRWRARLVHVLIAVAIGTTAPLGARQAPVDVGLFRDMAWRQLGPFRGGRTTVATGVPSQPNTFYAGTANGGVWKTTDAGRTWRPIFDDQVTGSVGSIAVASSHADIVYVGTGEAPIDRHASQGRGLYRSNDGGRSWMSLGLTEHVHLSAVLVDPRTPDRVFVASTGSAFGPSQDRGIYRSLDGGRSFERVYFKDDLTGALDLAFDPSDSSIVYATLVQARHLPSDDTAFGPGTGILRSTDGGTTWTSVATGLPTFQADGLRRIRVAPAPSNRERLFAAVDARERSGVYRSDDRGVTWTLVSPAQFVQPSNGTIAVDPSSAEIVYLTGARTLRSVDGARSFAVWPVDPPDGSRSVWLNPTHAAVSVLATDHGALVTVNGGESWSSRYNQPTGQFTDVVTDTAFPYRVCGAERNSPPGCLPSRGAGGRIALGEWRSVATAPGVSIAPDPQDADVVYSGSVGRFDRRSGQIQNVGPTPTPGDRTRASAPIVFSADNRTLYFGTSVVWRSVGGQNWTAMSPDLSREATGVISTIAPSAIDSRLIWVGTDDGMIQVTRDAGVTWSRMPPSDLATGWRIGSIEPSHFDVSTAYATASAVSRNDNRPHVWRTRDGGVTWRAIATGLPDDAVVYAVREDAFRRGLLFAGTARSVFVSFDDGERWQPLRLNLPPVPITDLTIKDADLVVATDGRGLWVLDDVSPFRQITADVTRVDMFLFRPPTAWRTHPTSSVDPTAHRDEPAGTNPPDGVAISYLTGAGPETVTLEIIETVSGEVIRRFDDLPATTGFHRVVWDLKYGPINARAVWVMPGTYQVRLTAGTRIARQAIIVRMDPRVRTSTMDLAVQFKLSKSVDDRRRQIAARRRDTSVNRDIDSALERVAWELDRILDLLQQADTRPTMSAESAANAAVAAADVVLAR